MYGFSPRFLSLHRAHLLSCDYVLFVMFFVFVNLYMNKILITKNRAHLECLSTDVIIWTQAPLHCPSDAMTITQSNDNTKTDQK